MAFTNALRRRIGASQFQLGEVRQGRDRTCVIAGCARIGSVEHNISSQIVADPIGLINQAGDISECPGINRPGRKGTISRSEGDKAESRPPASITTSYGNTHLGRTLPIAVHHQHVGGPEGAT